MEMVLKKNAERDLRAEKKKKVSLLSERKLRSDLIKYINPFPGRKH